MSKHFWITGLALLLTGCFGAPGYKGEAGPHFNGTTFQNQTPLNQDAFKLMRVGLGTLTNAADWPESVAVAEGHIESPRVTEGARLTFINHATFLLQVDGINILTDPVYGERTSPVSFAGPKRVHPPGIPFDRLPPIDIVLISHNHYDHLDVPTLERLVPQQPLVVAGLGNKSLLEEIGLTNVTELDWQQDTTVDDISIWFTETRHRSGRGITDHMKTLWGAFVLETSVGRIYFGGDTGYGPHFRDTGESFGPFALALLPIGAYEPRWFMKEVHLNPAEAVIAHQELQSELSIGIHFGTFQLTWEAIDQPLIDLAAALQAQELSPEVFRTLAVGETWVMTAENALSQAGSQGD